MTTPPNRRDDEVRRLLDTPHPHVPAGLAARAGVRGRRIARRRRVVRAALWTVLIAAAVAGIVLAVLAWPDRLPGGGTPENTWWFPTGPT